MSSMGVLPWGLASSPSPGRLGCSWGAGTPRALGRDTLSGWMAQQPPARAATSLSPGILQEWEDCFLPRAWLCKKGAIAIP